MSDEADRYLAEAESGDPKVCGTYADHAWASQVICDRCGEPLGVPQPEDIS